MFFVLDKGFGLSLWWAKLIANITGWLVNYLLQRYWVFKSDTNNKRQIEVTARYITITLIDFVLDYLIVALLKYIGVTPYIGQFVSSGFFTFWNYLWYKYWVFPDVPTRQKSIHKKPAHVFAHRSLGHQIVRKGS